MAVQSSLFTLFSVTGVIFWGWMNFYILKLSGVAVRTGLEDLSSFSDRYRRSPSANHYQKFIIASVHTSHRHRDRDLHLLRGCHFQGSCLKEGVYGDSAGSQDMKVETFSIIVTIHGPRSTLMAVHAG